MGLGRNRQRAVGPIHNPLTVVGLPRAQPHRFAPGTEPARAPPMDKDRNTMWEPTEIDATAYDDTSCTETGPLKVVAIIPARGGSMGLKRKNLREINGTPLVCHSIQAAQASCSLAGLFVSTEDPEIAEVAQQQGVQVIERPAAFATSESSMLPVLQHASQWLRDHGVDHTHIMTLQPTSPFRAGQHIDQAVEQFQTSQARSLISITDIGTHPSWTYRVEGSRVEKLLPDFPTAFRRQDLPPVYAPNGAIYISEVNLLLQEGKILEQHPQHYWMDPICSVDINIPMEMMWAEFLLQHHSELVDPKRTVEPPTPPRSWSDWEASQHLAPVEHSLQAPDQQNLDGPSDALEDTHIDNAPYLESVDDLDDITLPQHP